MNKSKQFENDYQELLGSLSEIIKISRQTAAKSVNKIMTETYSKIGIDVSEVEQNMLNPRALRFLGLKDDLAGKTLKECYLLNFENFFLNMNWAFTVVSKNKSIQIGNEIYYVDLVLFNRRLRCLVIIDLKLGKLTHADIGQMLLYTNYAAEHWREESENPPVGLILCEQNNEALAHYTLDLLPNKVLAKEYKMVLPDEKILVEQVEKTRRMLSDRKIRNPKSEI